MRKDPLPSTLFPHLFTMGGDRLRASMDWCKEQGLVKLKDYIVVYEYNAGFLYFKDSNDAVLFKLSRSGKV